MARAASRKNPDLTGPFRIDGVYCCLIPLSRGLWAIIDLTDFKRVAAHTWRSHRNVRSKTFYALTTLPRRKGLPRQTLWLHRVILHAKPGENVDHWNHNGLDNRRKNVRRCDQTGNNGNTMMSKANKSGAKGVFREKRRGTWVAAIQHKKLQFRKEFKSVEEAAGWYKAMANALFGEFANPTGAM